MPIPPKVTIYDVARDSGVSPATVSRSLIRPNKVRPRTLEQVLKSVERLGYRRDPSARPPGSRGTGTIAMVVPDISNPYFSDAIRGAEKRSQVANTGLLVVNTGEDSGQEKSNIDRLIGRVDGFILTSSRLSDKEIEILAARTPVVLLNRYVPGISCALVDQDQGSRHIIEHLCLLGHRRLTYVGGPVSSWVRHQRWTALSRYATHEGVQIEQLGPYRPSIIDGPAAAQAILRNGATAVIAHNDLLALGILRHLNNLGVTVPDEISVVGYDDVFAAEFSFPSLTTLGGPYEPAAYHGVEMLLEGKRGQRVILPSTLHVRDSTGPARQR